MFKPKLPKQEQGFTMVEVLIAIFIATIFVAVTMQMMAIAAMFKVRAQEYAEATAWIQEDLENVKYQAASYQYTSLTDEVTGDNTHESTDTVLHVSSVDRFNVGDTLIVGTDSTNNTIQSINSTANPPTITLTAALSTDWSTNTQVVATTKCNSLTADTGFADGLRDFINDPSDPSLNRISVPITKTSSFTQKQFSFTRITTIPSSASDAPYRVLQISYSVAPVNAHTTLSAAAAATSTTLTVASASGFKSGDKLTVGTDSDNEVQSVSGNTITLQAALGSDQPSGSIVDASVATTSTEVIPNAALQCPN